MIATYIDPFGAPEFLVDDVAFRSMVGTDYIRMGFYTQEPGEKILRVKLVFPLHGLIESQAATRLFVTTQQRSLLQRLGIVAN